jgi:hypothetical protein
MARKPRRRRETAQRSWAVIGSDETVQAFSRDRRDEMLAELELERLELQVEAFLEAMRLNTMVTMHQLAVLQQVMPHLHQLPPAMQENVMEAWQQTASRSNTPPPMLGNQDSPKGR